jgi:hypothetical protein
LFGTASPDGFALQDGLFLVVVRGRCGFLSLRDPTTRWSGHPRFAEVLARRTWRCRARRVHAGVLGFDQAKSLSRHPGAPRWPLFWRHLWQDSGATSAPRHSQVDILTLKSSRREPN